MDNLIAFLPKTNKLYPTSCFRGPFSLLAAMLCRLYGLLNCTLFNAGWAPLSHHFFTIEDLFNWAQILSVILKEAIKKYQKTPTSRKPTFYLSAYVIDLFCVMSPFPAIGWNWTRVRPPIHIYCSSVWEENFIPLIYDICNHFIGSIYHKLFKGDAPAFSNISRALISTMGGFVCW